MRSEQRRHRCEASYPKVLGGLLGPSDHYVHVEASVGAGEELIDFIDRLFPGGM